MIGHIPFGWLNRRHVKKCMIPVFDSDNKSYSISFLQTPPGHTLFKYFPITGNLINKFWSVFIFQVLWCKESKGRHVFPLGCPSIFLQGWLQNGLATWKGGFHCLQAIGRYTYYVQIWKIRFIYSCSSEMSKWHTLYALRFWTQQHVTHDEGFVRK